MSRRMVSARELVGRRIVAFDPGLSHEAHGGTATHSPTITLDDGSELYFIAEEQDETGEYGTFIGRRPPTRKVWRELEADRLAEALRDSFSDWDSAQEAERFQHHVRAVLKRELWRRQ